MKVFQLHEFILKTAELSGNLCFRRFPFYQFPQLFECRFFRRFLYRRNFFRFGFCRLFRRRIAVLLLLRFIVDQFIEQFIVLRQDLAESAFGVLCLGNCFCTFFHGCGIKEDRYENTDQKKNENDFALCESIPFQPVSGFRLSHCFQPAYFQQGFRFRGVFAELFLRFFLLPRHGRRFFANDFRHGRRFRRRGGMPQGNTDFFRRFFWNITGRRRHDLLLFFRRFLRQGDFYFCSFWLQCDSDLFFFCHFIP